MSTESFAILTTTCLGKKKEKGLLKASTSKIDIMSGTLLRHLDIVKHSTTSPTLYVFESIDHQLENIELEVTCKQGEFEDITRNEYNLLITIFTCQDRLAVFYNKQLLQEGNDMKVGDYVEVYHKNEARDLPGILRYKGFVNGVDGIHFGVELFDKGLGVCDGRFRHKQYFTCAQDSAVFVGLHRIKRRKDITGRDQVKSNVAGAVAIESHRQVLNGLHIGDSVVWVSDDGPEVGVVKWIGLLPDHQNQEDITVGVEFKNPVGSGTGKYNDQRLFTAKLNHASLVPILGLIKADEFYGMAGGTKENDFSAYLKPSKSQQEVIFEQTKLLEEAKARQNTGTWLSAETQRHPSQHDEINVSENLQARTGSTEIVYAVVHSELTPPSSHQGVAVSKGVNPLYEYTRSSNDYLPDKLGTVATSAAQNTQPVLNSCNKQLPEPDPELVVGSLVEVLSSKPLYGVIKWIGHLPDQKEHKKLIAGLEMEVETTAGTDGTFGAHRLFNCPHRKGLFVPLYKCKKDKRFADDRNRRSLSSEHSVNFGSTETPDLPGIVSPPDSLGDVSIFCGKGKGIQGHHNSCYMDATVLSMFYFTTVFDSMLYRPLNETDIPEYVEVQQVLKEGIVNPLRTHHYVRADKMMKLRRLLDKVGKIPGMLSEEKDPEEFLNLLLNEIMHTDPFLKISAADNQETQQTYFYQLIMEKDERLVLPTTQQLFELSFLQMGIKLKEIPLCLIVQMPRFGKDYKMYKRILPSLELDITDVLESAPRECIICGDLAVFECQQCYQVHGAGLNTIAFCEGCKTQSHKHKQRVGHNSRQIQVPSDYLMEYKERTANGQKVHIPREKMELFAVICIQTSHYVCFVKTGNGHDAKWIFFDSMADRMGEQSGYNIPEIKECSDMLMGLSDDYYDIMKCDDRTLPEHMRRLICDAYICMYQSPDIMKFK